jgi:DNA-directed RNA polymerase subunit M/transcription elongation factor TFIIS
MAASQPQKQRPQRDLFLPICYFKENPIRGIKHQDIDRVLQQYDEYCDLPIAKRLELVGQLEDGCYAYSLDASERNNISLPSTELIWFYEFAMLYCGVCFNVMSKLDMAQGTMAKRLMRRLFDGEIDPRSIASMTGEEYVPELYAEHRAKYITVSNVSESVKTSELYTCYRCGKNQCIIEKNPCRSADEQIPLRITCMFCNNKWSG